MAIISLNEALERALNTVRYIEVSFNGDSVSLPYDEIDKKSALDEFISRYKGLKEILTKDEREYGVSLVEDVIKIQRGIINLYDYAEYQGIQDYVDNKLSEIDAFVERRKQEDYDEIYSCFESDETKANIELAKQRGLSDEEIQERNNIFRAVGYLWFFLDKLPIGSENARKN